MAKKRQQKHKQLPFPGQLTFQLGPTEPIDIRSVDEAWCDYRLTDGTVLSVKPMVADIQRVKGKYNEQGDPLYLVTGALVIRTKSPARLKKKGK